MKEKSLSEYQDIIDRKHPVSANHPPMDPMKRAAQFAPFAALTGYEDALDAAEGTAYKTEEKEPYYD
jgi:hypothetical protein